MHVDVEDPNAGFRVVPMILAKQCHATFADRQEILASTLGHGSSVALIGITEMLREFHDTPVGFPLYDHVSFVVCLLLTYLRLT